MRRVHTVPVEHEVELSPLAPEVLPDLSAAAAARAAATPVPDVSSASARSPGDGLPAEPVGACLDSDVPDRPLGDSTCQRRLTCRSVRHYSEGNDAHRPGVRRGGHRVRAARDGAIRPAGAMLRRRTLEGMIAA
jgi:hypothetical protein